MIAVLEATKSRIEKDVVTSPGPELRQTSTAMAA
jgi:hypothetical protein